MFLNRSSTSRASAANDDNVRNTQILLPQRIHGKRVKEDARSFYGPQRQCTAPITPDVFERIPIASPSQRKQTEKKQKITSTKSTSKNSDERALFSKATTSTKNYIKGINDLLVDIESDVLTRNHLLDELPLAQRRLKKTCYFCQYSSFNHCANISQNRKSKNFAFLDEIPHMPDIELINKFNVELLSQYVNCTSESGFFSLNENNIINKDDKQNEIANKFDLQLELNSLNENNLSEMDKVSSVSNVDNVNQNSDTQDIQFDELQTGNILSTERLQKYSKDPNDLKKTLQYFGLSSIEDLFVGSDNEDVGNESDSTIILSPHYFNENTASSNAFVISDSESDLEDNTDSCTDVKLPREQNTEAEIIQAVASANKEVTKNIASSTSNRTINSPCDASEDEVQIIEPYVSISVVSDSDSDSENNTKMSINDKLLRELNNKSDSKETDNGLANKVIETYVISDSDSDLECSGWMDQFDYTRY